MNTLRSNVLRASCIAAGVAAPTLAMAHGGVDGGAHHDALPALFAGFAHPFSGADHWAAMLALGVWSGLAVRRAWVAPMCFVALLGGGAVAARAGMSLPAVEPMIAASLLVLGVMITLQWRWPVGAGAALAALFALFHGHAHGAELAGAAPAWALLGMMAATAVLHGAGILAARWAPRRAPWLPRLAGAGLALFGAVLLGPFA